MSLAAAFTTSFPGFDLDIDLAAPGQGVTCPFGPSGAGKSTVLRCLAGLTPCRGRIACGETVWQDDAAGVLLPPEQRGVGFVFQDAALFPHLDVAGNLAFAADRAPAEAAPASIPRISGGQRWAHLP